MAEAETTSLDEIRRQVQPTIIEIPGYQAGATIRVAVRPVDLTPHLLEAGIGNPLLATGEEPRVAPAKLLPILEAVAREVLVQPTYEELAAICPLTLPQKLALLNHAMGGIAEMRSFRGESGV